MSLRRHLVAAACILAAAFAAYSNSLRNGFVWDDKIYVESNPLLREPSNARLLLHPGLRGALAPSRPVFLASLLADRALWGFDPRGYHLTNLLLHAADGLWVYALACAFAAAWWACLLAGLLFTLHPVLTEAVDGICFRADLLAAFFVFSSLWAFLKARSPRPAAWLCASAGLFALGLLSKESAASLPVLAILAEACFPRSEGRARRLALGLCLYAAAAAAFAVYWSPRFRYEAPAGSLRPALDRLSSALPPGPEAPPLPAGHFLPPSSSQWAPLYRDRRTLLWTMSRALAEYFKLLAWPDPLVVDRAPEVRRGPPWPSLAFLAGIALLAAALVRTRPVASYGIAWCFASLLPVLGLYPLYNPVAERYLYLAAAGFAWAAAQALQGRRAAVLAGLALSVFWARTFVRNLDWRSEEALFLERAPRAGQNARAFFLRGGLLRRQGRKTEAVREYEAAVERFPGYAEAWLDLGLIRADLGEQEKARACLEKAESLAPSNPVVKFAAALGLSRAGDFPGALRRYREALAIEPAYLEAWVNLGALLREHGRLKEGAACFEKALALSPGDPVPYFSYALLKEKAGDRTGAESLYLAALKKDPSFFPARERLSRLFELEGRPAEARAVLLPR
jgi:tetratricopeptide (TPR) repeat protein